jgi:hypothetical protein
VTKSDDENQKTAQKDTTNIKSLRQSPRKEPSQKHKASSPLSFRDADSGLPPASTDSTLSRAHLQAQLEFPLKNFKRNSRKNFMQAERETSERMRKSQGELNGQG